MKSGRISNYFFPLTFAIFIIIIWHAFSANTKILQWIIPSPASIINVFVDYPGLIASHAVITICETLLGLFLSLLLGVILAIGMNRWDIIRQTIYPFVVISQTIPIIALAPLFIIWFGYGITAKVLIVTLVCFFPIAVNLYDGLNMVNVEHLRLFKSMNANPWQTFILLKIPSSMPSFFSGLKLAVSYSVMAAIIGEWLGGEKGLGIYMTRATKSYQTAHVFAIIIVIAVISLILYGIVLMLERILLRWRFIRLAEFIDTIG